jgi:hypothetical protein
MEKLFALLGMHSLSLTHLGSPGKYELNLVDFFQAASFMVKTLAEVEATNQPERFADMEMKVKFVYYCIYA